MPLFKFSHMAIPSCIREAGKSSLVGQPHAQSKLKDSITKEDGDNVCGDEWPSPPPGVPCSHRNSGQNVQRNWSLELGKHSFLYGRQTQRGYLLNFTKVSGRPTLGFRCNSKPSAQNWGRDCKGVGGKGLVLEEL